MEIKEMVESCVNDIETQSGSGCTVITVTYVIKRC